MEGSASPRRIPRFAYAVGQVVRHREHGFRGVIVDAHARFRGPADPDDLPPPLRERLHQPWYEVLVHDQPMVAYLPEDLVEADLTCMPVAHPLLRMFFNEFRHGAYSVGGVEN